MSFNLLELPCGHHSPRGSPSSRGSSSPRGPRELCSPPGVRGPFSLDLVVLPTGIWFFLDTSLVQRSCIVIRRMQALI